MIKICALESVVNDVPCNCGGEAVWAMTLFNIMPYLWENLMCPLSFLLYSAQKSSSFPIYSAQKLLSFPYILHRNRRVFQYILHRNC